MIHNHLAGSTLNKYRVTTKDFDKQLRLLSILGYKSLTMSEFIKNANINNKTVVITFDDGFEDNYTNAFPILKKYNFKATIYLTTRESFNTWDSKLSDEKVSLLQDSQIKEMINSGLIEIGSHTMHHKNLENLTPEDAFTEIAESKKDIESRFNCACTSFAYPYGRLNEETVSMVRKAGYTNAAVLKKTHRDSKFTIQRIIVCGYCNIVKFLFKFILKANKQFVHI